MLLKSENGITGIDITVSILLITIFIVLISTLISNINQLTNETDMLTEATSYAIDEIEKIKKSGYISEFDGKGTTNIEIIESASADINNEEGKFTGFHKEVSIIDYAYGKENKLQDIIKKITVEISYNVKSKVKNVTISTYVVNEY